MSHDGAGQPAADAVPGADRSSLALPVLFTLQVDGEEWAVRRSVDRGTHYECISNPALDRGFATSDSPDRPKAEHLSDLRESLPGPQ
jgi:hypothetical protein